jgi:hypothetical protein
VLDKLKGLLRGKKNEAKQAVDKVADVADDKSGGRFTDQIETGAEKAKDVVEGVAEA